MIRPNFLSVLLFLLGAPTLVFAGDGEGLNIPQHTCDRAMVETIYREERADLMDMIRIHFVENRSGLSDEEFCAELERAFDGVTEATTGCVDCGNPEPPPPVELDRSGLGREEVRVIQSHVPPPPPPPVSLPSDRVTTQSTTSTSSRSSSGSSSSSSGGFFSNPFWGGFLGGALGGFLGGMIGGAITSGNNSGGQYGPYPPPFMPPNPYGRPPWMPPGIAGPIQPPGMLQPMQPWQFPFSGASGQPPPGFWGNQGGGGLFPGGQGYFGALPSYMTGVGYPGGVGYNPYAPAIAGPAFPPYAPY